MKFWIAQSCAIKLTFFPKLLSTVSLHSRLLRLEEYKIIPSLLIQHQPCPLPLNPATPARRPTLGDTTLMSSLRKRNLPTSLWKRLPQFFIQASSTCKRAKAEEFRHFLPVPAPGCSSIWGGELFRRLHKSIPMKHSLQTALNRFLLCSREQFNACLSARGM